jgi:NADPH:quinone reductase-like Zn-dependent oxidoreductase
MVVQMANALGAEVIVTTTSTAKDAYLRGLGVANIVHLGMESLVASRKQV